jgi:Protein of unknown function (DUF2914)
MKKLLISCLAVSLLAVAGYAKAQQMPAPAASETAPAKAEAVKTAGFTITRMEIASDVKNHEPVGISNSFPANTEKVYCYLELANVTADSPVTYVWTLGLNEMARVTQTPKRTVARYRTWSSKNIGGLKGDWKVDILDASGKVLKTATFKVM